MQRIYPTKGEVFNHDYHQAVSRFATKDQPNNTVFDIIRAGYIIQGDNLSLQDSSVSIMIGGSLKNYKITEINSIYAGKRAGMFNTIGAVVGCATIMTPLLIIGGDFTDYFGTTLTLSAMGGGVIGFATPLLLRSVGRDGIKWSLIYSV